MKKNINNSLIYLIIILIIIILGLTGYIIYDNLSLKRENNNIKENETNQVQLKLSEEELNKYLSYVPFEYNSHSMFCEWNNTVDCQDEIKYLDAYSKNLVTIEDIDDELMLRMAIYKTENVTQTDSFEADFEICGKDENNNSLSCTLSEYYKTDAVLTKVKEMYNKNVLPKDFSVGSGYAYYKNGYFAIGHGSGNYPPTKINKIEKYNITDNELIIYEKALFIFEITTKNEVVDITKTTNYKNEDILISYKYDSCEQTDPFCSNSAKNFAKNNLDKSNTFRHIFKKSKNDNYYWYSTEVVY